MYKLLIISHGMEIGGAESALLGLLENIAPKRVAVDLFLLRHSGELMKFIPSYANLLPQVAEYASINCPFLDTIKNGFYFVALGRAYGKLRTFLTKPNNKDGHAIAINYSHKYTRFFMPMICPSTKYDCVISFLTPHYFAVEKVNAKKKIAWIHTDYGSMEIDKKAELKMWDKYDHIISISDSVTSSFLKVMPSLKSKIVKIENILPINYIQILSSDLVPNDFVDDESIRILSIGRFVYPKNFDSIPEICLHILNKGLKIKWYIIGYGIEEALIRQKIEESGLEDYVIILGKKDNPYPYIKACDLYVQPSRYEGKCVAVREAQMLGKPVVITNYTTSASQLEDGVDGVIVPMDNEGCAEGIAALLRDKEKMNRLSAACKSRDYSNSDEIKKLYQLLV